MTRVPDRSDVPEVGGRRVPADLADRLLDVRRIFHEPDIERSPRARQMLDRCPDAERIEVLSQVSHSGQTNVRYRLGWKGRWLQQLTDLVAARLPECRVRYAF